MQGNTIHNGRVDLQVLAPMFDGMGKRSSEFVAGADSKACLWLSALPFAAVFPASFTKLAFRTSCFMPSVARLMTAALMQAMRVETSPGHVESAVMLLVDMESASAEMRLSAIARRYPLHTIMFAQDGSLLIANRAALEAFQLNASGAPLPLQTSLTPMH